MDQEEALDFRDDIKSRLIINEYQLIEECTKQPAFYEEVSSGFAQMKHNVKKAKGMLEFKKSEIERAIRRDPKKFGIEKVTETVVVATIVVQDGYQEALKSLWNTEEVVDMVSACVLAVEHRKSMIRDLVTLFDRDYRNSEFVIHGTDRQAGDNREREIVNSRKRRASKAKDNGKG